MRQCCNCHQWITKGKGAYMKHIQHCQPKSTGSSVLDHDGIKSQNPLHSLTTDAQSPNINYNCNLYNDQYADDDLQMTNLLSTMTVTLVIPMT
jgi:hypothetical protein